MTTWDDRIKDHPLHTDIQHLRAALLSAGGSTEDADAAGSVARLKVIEGYLSRMLKGMEPSLVAPATLNAIQPYVRAATKELNAFASNKNAGHLVNANNQLDNALPQVRLLFVPSSKADIGGVQESVVRFRRSAGQHLGRLEKRVREVSAAMSQANNVLADQVKTIEGQKGRLDQAIQTFVNESSASQREASSDWADLLANAKSDVSALSENARTELDKLRVDSDAALKSMLGRSAERTNTTLDDLEEQLGKAREIVGIIAATGIAGNYQKQADQEYELAERWRWIALASMAGIVGFAVYAMASTVGTAFEVGEFMSKVFVSLTFGVIAAYAGREAEKHRHSERRNRRLYLEMASLDAYLQSLPENERHAIKVAVADRIFGQQEEPLEGEPSSTSSMLEFFKLVGRE